MSGHLYEQAAAGHPECLCHCGADAIDTDDEGRWVCGRHSYVTPYNVWIQRPGGEWEFWGGYSVEARAIDDLERTQETHPEWEVELRD